MTVKATGMWAGLQLEVLDFAENRHVVKDEAPDGTIADLIPAMNTSSHLVVRLPGGRPFTVAVDSQVVAEVIIPWVNSRCAAGCGRAGTRELFPGLMSCSHAECEGKLSSILIGAEAMTQ